MRTAAAPTGRVLAKKRNRQRPLHAPAGSQPDVVSAAHMRATTHRRARAAGRWAPLSPVGGCRAVIH